MIPQNRCPIWQHLGYSFDFNLQDFLQLFHAISSCTWLASFVPFVPSVYFTGCVYRNIWQKQHNNVWRGSGLHNWNTITCRKLFRNISFTIWTVFLNSMPWERQVHITGLEVFFLTKCWACVKIAHYHRIGAWCLLCVPHAQVSWLTFTGSQLIWYHAFFMFLMLRSENSLTSLLLPHASTVRRGRKEKVSVGGDGGAAGHHLQIICKVVTLIFISKSESLQSVFIIYQGVYRYNCNFF